LGWVGSGHTKWTHGQLWGAQWRHMANMMDRSCGGGDVVDFRFCCY